MELIGFLVDEDQGVQVLPSSPNRPSPKKMCHFK